MLGVGFKSDIEKFKFALRAKKAACQKTLPDILNHAAKNIAFRSSSFVPKANPARIRSELMRDPHLRFALTSMALKRKGIGRLKSPEFARAVLKYVGRRVSSANYLRASFANAIEQLGGTFRGKKMRGASGFANKAQVSRFIVEIVSIVEQPTPAKANSAEAIMQKAAWEAIRYVTEDILVYARRKLEVAAAT